MGRLKRLLLVLGGGLAAGFIATAFIVQKKMHNRYHRASAFQTAMAGNYQSILQAAIITGAQVPDGASIPLDRLLAQMSRLGLQRLDDQEIQNLIQLRADFANHSDTQACAALWTGYNGDYIRAIDQLPADQSKRWAALFKNAAEAILNRLPVRPAPPAAQYQAALSGVLNTMPKDDLDAIRKTVDETSLSTPEQECKAARAFYNGLEHANSVEAVTIARGMLYQ